MKEYIIDKVTNFTNWNNIGEFGFSSPWSEEALPTTLFSAYHDGNSLYFRFMAFGPKPLVYIHDNNKLEVTKSERVELFFRSNEKMQPYYCLEMDPKGRILDYKANFYRQFDRNWQWPESLNIQTKIEKQHYNLQGKISLSVLDKLGILKNNKIEVGVYRGHCIELKDSKAIIKWISWVDPKTKKPDFHVPSSFGVFILN